jgi:hypothetical protein
MVLLVIAQSRTVKLVQLQTELFVIRVLLATP